MNPNATPATLKTSTNINPGTPAPATLSTAAGAVTALEDTFAALAGDVLAEFAALEALKPDDAQIRRRPPLDNLARLTARMACLLELTGLRVIRPLLHSYRPGPSGAAWSDEEPTPASTPRSEELIEDYREAHRRIVEQVERFRHLADTLDRYPDILFPSPQNPDELQDPATLALLFKRNRQQMEATLLELLEAVTSLKPILAAAAWHIQSLAEAEAWGLLPPPAPQPAAADAPANN